MAKFYPLTHLSLATINHVTVINPGSDFLVSATGDQLVLQLSRDVISPGFFQVEAGTATIYNVTLYGRLSPEMGWAAIYTPVANTSGIWAADLPPFLKLNIGATNGTLRAGVFA